MYLPNAPDARVEKDKILGYLLNEDHPDGRHKAALFRRFGFRRAAWDTLRRALRNHAVRHEVSSVHEFSYGAKFVVEGLIDTPSDRPLSPNRMADPPRLGSSSAHHRISHLVRHGCGFHPRT
jgi:hypothetical protein